MCCVFPEMEITGVTSDCKSRKGGMGSDGDNGLILTLDQQATALSFSISTNEGTGRDVDDHCVGSRDDEVRATESISGVGLVLLFLKESRIAEEFRSGTIEAPTGDAPRPT